MTQTAKTPREARTGAAIGKLSHDNVGVKDFSIMLDERVVWLSEQPMGSEQKQHITIPRPIFDAFVEWYTTGKVPRGDKAARTPKREKVSA